ncbi:MAG: VWA domain-containing protein [Pyrinomonadaceae bacterium]
MKIKHFLVTIAAIAGLLQFVYAQDKPKTNRVEDEVVKVDTQLVDVPIVVTDKAGKPLLNLKQTNFLVYEDGKRQEVLDFSTTSAPFEVALLLDTSGSARSDLPLMRKAAEYFVASLRPGDRVSIVAYDTDRTYREPAAVTEILSPLTDDRKDLIAAIGRVNTSNGTPYYDSLLQVADRVFGRAPSEEFRGRRALVALTDGVDSTSIIDFTEAKDALQAAGIANYFIQVDTRPFFEENLLGDCETAIRFSQAQIRRYYRTFKSKPGMERSSDFCELGDFERLAISKTLYELADAEMEMLAKSSGGRVFPAADLNDARNAFRSVAVEIGNKYTLGYYSSNERKDGTYRKINVVLKGVPIGSKIRAREGYTAPAN